MLFHAFVGRLAFGLANAQSLGDDCGHDGGIGNRAQRNEVDTGWKAACQLAHEFNGEMSFPDAAGPSYRYQARLAAQHKLEDLLEVLFPADQWGAGGG